VRAPYSTYVYYPGTGEVDMYDLNTDPYEERSLDGRAAYEVQERHRRRLRERYRNCDGAQCR
jgi:hypothetical protein